MCVHLSRFRNHSLLRVYFVQLTFENVETKGINFGVGHDGVPLMPGNDYVPLVSNMKFVNITRAGRPICIEQQLDRIAKACEHCNQSKCFNTVMVGPPAGEGSHCPKVHTPPPSPPLATQQFSCKRTAKTMFGVLTLPWGVCVPLDAPVNLDPNYPNYGPTTGTYKTLAACKSACV